LQRVDSADQEHPSPNSTEPQCDVVCPFDRPRSEFVEGHRPKMTPTTASSAQAMVTGEVDSAAVGEDPEQRSDLEMILEGMTERQIAVDLVSIPATDLLV